MSFGAAAGPMAAALAVAVVAVVPRGHDAAPAPPVSGGAVSFEALPAYGTYAWPVEGPVLRPFEAPSSPYGAGHRGIDIAVPVGSMVGAAGNGVVAFAGQVAGSLYVSVDHPDGVRTTYGWLSSLEVRAGDPVARGDALGASGLGHPGVGPAHLHLGARFAGEYLDPMLLLEGGGVVGLIHLAPLPEEAMRQG